jgi:hypothetical protein
VGEHLSTWMSDDWLTLARRMIYEAVAIARDISSGRDGRSDECTVV